MTGARLTGARIRAGWWEGVLAAPAAPQVAVTHEGQALGGVTIAPRDGAAGEWVVRVPIPAAALSDGVQTFVVAEAGSGARLGHFTLVTGVPLEDDLRAEIDLLRAEIDLLKRAFRRHCAETAG